jgi:hypothetical protein
MVDFLRKDVADESKQTDINRRELLKKNLPAMIAGMLTAPA